MNYLYKKIIALVAFLVLIVDVHSQVIVSATIDSTSILMGNQTIVHLHVSQPQNISLEYPVINDMLAPEVYVVDVTGDTIADDETITINNDIIVTGFEPGSYSIPPFVCKDADKNYSSDSLKIEIRDLKEQFEIGKAPEDIKGVENPPHSKILWIVFYVSIALFVVFSLLAFFYWKKHNADPEPYVRNNAVAESQNPELTAIELIHKLVKEKKWMPLGNVKRYYTELTDILRQYFYRRYSINALEMTSSELYDALKKTDMPSAICDEVREICFTGDMTKFAKHNPTEDECVHCADLAEHIVKETSVEDTKVTETK